MSDDLIKADSAEVRRLKSLSPLFLKGWAKRHPMPERDRALIEQAFSQPKAQTKEKAAKTPTKTAKTDRVRRKSATKAKSDHPQTKTQGPSHSH